MTFNFPAPTVARHHPAFFWTLLVMAADTGLKSSLSPLLRLKRGYATAVSLIGKKLVDARVLPLGKPYPGGRLVMAAQCT